MQHPRIYRTWLSVKLSKDQIRTFALSSGTYSGYHDHQSNAILMYYIITVYTSASIKLYQKY